MTQASAPDAVTFDELLELEDRVEKIRIKFWLAMKGVKPCELQDNDLKGSVCLYTQD